MGMKKTSAPQEATIFKFKFTPLMWTLAVAALLLCVAGIGLSIWRILSEGIQDFNDVLKSPFLILISLFGVVLVVSLMLRSRYIVTDTQLVLQLGLIKNKYPIEKITSLLLDTDTHKLTVYMGEEYFVVNTDPDWNNDFVQAVRDVKPEVEFSFTLAEPKEKK